MLFRIDIDDNKLLYGVYSTDKPYPKNTFIKKEVNKRLLHVVNSIQKNTNLDLKCSVCSIFCR